MGTPKTVTGTGFTLGGTDAGNYHLASSTLTTTANITAATISGRFTAANKVYDGAALGHYPDAVVHHHAVRDR